tara:strand:- start:727 stop:1206 length:480 start_codon:yes stop_codon:yes gene_type:complete
MHAIGSLEYTVERRKEIRHLGQKFVLTNGCFDILHAGHVHVLTQASKLGFLSVAVNSDSSVKSLKGPERPIVNENYRLMTVNALKPVSNVFLFNTRRLDREIRLIKPDIYVKASDYTEDTINQYEKEALQEVGCEIKFVPILYGLSTTEIIDKIRNYER